MDKPANKHIPVRYPKPGNTVGDTVQVKYFIGSRRWRKVDKDFHNDTINAVIVERYFTYNKGFKNYQGKVKLPNGKIYCVSF